MPASLLLLASSSSKTSTDSSVLGSSRLIRYANVLGPKDRTLLIKSLDVNRSGRLNLFELRSFFKSFVRDQKGTIFIEFSLRVLARILDKNMVSSTDYLLSKQVDLNQRISFDMFCILLPDLLKLDLRECGTLFKEIDFKEEGSITARQLIEAINEFRTESFKEYFTAGAKFQKKPETRSQATPGEAKDLQQVLKKIIGHKKINLKGFFKLLIDSTDNDPEKGIPMDVVKDTVDVAFVDLLNEYEKSLLKNSLDTNGNRFLEPVEMLTTLKDSIADQGDKIQMHFEFWALVLDKKNIATEDFFYPHGIYRAREYDQATLVPCAVRSLALSREDATHMFKILADRAVTVPGDDLVDCVNSFRKLSPKPLCGAPPAVYPAPPVVQPSPGLPAPPIKPPTLQKTEAVEAIKRALAKNRMTPIQVYRLADPEEVGSVSVITFKQTLQFLLPQTGPDVIFSCLKALDINRDGFLQLQDYEIMMLSSEEDLRDIKDNDSRVSEHNPLPEVPHMPIAPPIADNRLPITRQDSEISEIGTPRSAKGPSGVIDASATNPEVCDHKDPAVVAKSIGTWLQKDGLDPEVMISFMDPEVLGCFTVHQALENLIFFMPGADKKGLLKALKYMDSDKDGFIQKGDFLAAISGKAPRPQPASRFEKAQLEEGDQALPGGSPAQAKQPSTSGRQDPISAIHFYNKVRELRNRISEEQIQVAGLFPEDPEEQTVSVTGLATKLHQLLPEFNRKTLIEVLRYVDVDDTGLISQSEFELMIGYNPEVGEIEQSVIFQERAVDTDAIAKIKQMVGRKGMNESALFKSCDSDRNGLINILDLKRGLERALAPQESEYQAVISFVKEVKAIFKTAEFDEPRFLLFLKDQGKMAIHQVYDQNKQGWVQMTDSDAQGGPLEQAFKLLKTSYKLNSSAMAQLSTKFDSDKDGYLTDTEFKQALKSIPNIQLTPEQLNYLVNVADKNKDNRVNLDEFLLYLETEVELESGGPLLPLGTSKQSKSSQSSLVKQASATILIGTTPLQEAAQDEYLDDFN